jgi:hypothetical protein
MRTSENSVKAKFAERTSYELRWISPAVSIDQYPPRPLKWLLIPNPGE